MQSSNINSRGSLDKYKLPTFTRDSTAGDRKSRYRFLWRWVVIVTSLVTLIPLFILTFMNYFQYKRSLTKEVKERVSHITSSTKRSIEFFLSERRATLSFIAREYSFEELSDQKKLGAIFHNLQTVLGGIVDLGFIGADGRQISYVGPYELVGEDYSDEDWLHEVTVRGHYVSDVFLGHRAFPHFLIAVAKRDSHGRPYVLRATIDSETLVSQLRSLHLVSPSEAFIINHQGVLQTPSDNYGRILDEAVIEVPRYSPEPVVSESGDFAGSSSLQGFAYINQSPFILVVIKHPLTAMGNWFELRRNLWLVLVLSSMVIILIITGVSYYMVSRIREADSERSMILHRVEYQNKMASLGRLAAGVAHEINNPLAIINEKAGMIKDVINMQEDFPRKDKTLELTESIHKSVQRCSRITRRLLGFAKHIDVKIETVELEILIKEVIGFLEHEAKYRKISIEVEPPQEEIPAIQSDRGQLEQAFLNIINNSMNALSDSGKEGLIKISLHKKNGDFVLLNIKDNGPGISKENLKHIFEPFFTTRKEGTGLGLSITFGIIEKLRGHINVDSEPGKGTSFKITLPIRGI